MEHITPQQLAAWINERKDFILIDVREEWERNIYNIGGIHAPINEFAVIITSITKDKPVVIYCEKGIRSIIAIQRLEQAGYTRLYNLAGGMANWKKQELS